MKLFNSDDADAQVLTALVVEQAGQIARLQSMLRHKIIESEMLAHRLEQAEAIIASCEARRIAQLS